MRRLAFTRRGAALVAAVTLLSLAPLTAQDMSDTAMDGEGLIVRLQSAELVFIDLGAQHGLTRGDLFDIVSTEMLVHPLSDSILAVTPKIIGALQVLQVYDKTALARLIALDSGEDPMLKPITRVRDAERQIQLEKMLVRGVRAAAGMDISRRVAIIPGLYQLRLGETRKGWGLLGASSAALIGGFAYRSNSNDWHDQYRNLPAGLPESDYTFYFTKAQDRRTSSNRLFWLAGALYVYNWVDILWLGDAASMAQHTPSTRRWHADVGFDASRQPLLRLTRRF